MQFHLINEASYAICYSWNPRMWLGYVWKLWPYASSGKILPHHLLETVPGFLYQFFLEPGVNSWTPLRLLMVMNVIRWSWEKDLCVLEKHTPDMLMTLLGSFVDLEIKRLFKLKCYGKSFYNLSQIVRLGICFPFIISAGFTAMDADQL